jgi:hypothetical protein
MMKGNTLREIRFKDGYRIKKGDMILLFWPDPRGKATCVEVHHGGRLIFVPSVTALAWIGHSASPSELEEATFDGTCETPNGHTVEPDGVDPEGVPSWLLIHGLI